MSKAPKKLTYIFRLVLLTSLAAWCAVGCSIIRQRTSSTAGGTNHTAVGWCISLWEGRAVVEKMSLTAGPPGVAVGVEGQSSEATSTNIIPTIQAVTELLRAIPRP